MVCNGIISSNMMYIEIEYSKSWATTTVAGDMISTTTASIEYCSMSHRFVKCDSYAEAFVFYHSDDYSEYETKSCRNGGRSGYDFYIVANIIDVVEEEHVEDRYAISCDIEGIEFDIDEIEELEEILGI